MKDFIIDYTPPNSSFGETTLFSRLISNASIADIFLDV